MCSCTYSRRKLKFFANESLYIPGTTTTLKIYNKLLEFQKHDRKKFIDTNFDIIQGFVRFEVEIKKKKLQKIFGEDLKHIKVENLEYNNFEKVWSEEFMRLLGFLENDLKIVRGKDDVKKRLLAFYKKSKAMRLFNFYCSVQMNGIDFVKKDMTNATFYRYVSDLKLARVDYSQMYEINEVSNFYFNPFEYEEVI